MNRRELGALGEALALRYMQERGFVLLAKNNRLCRSEDARGLLGLRLGA